MSVAQDVETAAEVVAELSGTIAEAAGAVDDVVESGRSLIKLIMVAIIGLALIGLIVKLVAGNQENVEPAPTREEA